MDFQLTEINIDIHSFVSEQLKAYCSRDKLSDAVQEFLDDLSWHLQKPLCIYKPKRMPDKNVHTLGEIYLYDAWNYFFISYFYRIYLFLKFYPLY